MTLIKIKPKSVLKSVRIASPCSVAWDSMIGDDRKRFCNQCNLHVYNFADMSEDEIADLICNNNQSERVCARIFRRADGTILTKDCPVGLRKLRQACLNFWQRTAVVVAWLVSLGTQVQAHEGAPQPKRVSLKRTPMVFVKPNVPVPMVEEYKQTHRSESFAGGIGDINFGPYMAHLQTRILRSWVPGEDFDLTKRCVCRFSIERSGNISHLKLVTSCGSMSTDQAAMLAINNSAPFHRLPDGAADSVDVEFTFDQRMVNNKKEEHGNPRSLGDACPDSTENSKATDGLQALPAPSLCPTDSTPDAAKMSKEESDNLIDSLTKLFGQISN